MEVNIRTSKREEFINITSYVKGAIKESGVENGIAIVFVPHTTAAVTINENADPDVTIDIINGLNEIVPNLKTFRHIEGNSDAHIKASLIGSSVTVIIENGNLKLGTWQGIYFCEFDGPRLRKFYVKIIEG
ncbi:MAG: secondary thiamine-phosphate synthase enzyme YjbQ [Caloramator sp.]|nr:secondary thiamine-phosphate synthase enzyme YjbQ [Caloramator sp.]